jgi:hypothetical protein
VDEAAPFFLAALLALVTAIATWFVQNRAEEYIRREDEDFSATPEGEAAAHAGGQRLRPSHLSPENIGAVAAWATDVGPSLVTAASPLLTAALLLDQPPRGVILACVGVGLLGAMLFVWGLRQTPVDYINRKYFQLTMLSGIGIVLNSTVGIVVLLITS